MDRSSSSTTFRAEQGAPLPAGPGQRRIALALTGLLLAAGLVLAPLAATPVSLLPSFFSELAAALLAGNLLLALLAYQRGSAEGRTVTVLLAGIFLFTGLMALPRLVIAAEPAWLWICWHGGFAGLMLRLALAQQRESSGSVMPMNVRQAVAGALVLAALLIMMAVVGSGLLPLTGLRRTVLGAGVLLLNLAALALIARRVPHGGSESLWLAVALLASCIAVWLALFQGAERHVIGGYVAGICRLTIAAALAVPLLQDLGALHRRVQHADALVASLAYQDGLTGLANRRRFDEVLAAEWTRSFRAELPLALLRIDVDLLQRYNVRYGHAEGDEVLRRIGGLLAQTGNRRAGDLSARISGDEFAVILPDTDISGAAVLAALVRRELAELALPHQESPTGCVTVSVGIALTQARQTGPLDLLRAADDALFRAKSDGRDQASLAPIQDTIPMSAAEDWPASQPQSGYGKL